MDNKNAAIDPKETDAWRKHLDTHRDQLTDEQLSVAQAAQDVFLQEIKEGKHRRLEILMSRPEGAEELRSKVTEEIFHLVGGYVEDPHYISGALLAALNEPDIMQHSPVETAGERLLRLIDQREEELSGKRDELEGKDSVKNYLQWRAISKEEEEGILPEGSAEGFLEDLHKHKKPFPKAHEIHVIEAALSGKDANYALAT